MQLCAPSCTAIEFQSELEKRKILVCDPTRCWKNVRVNSKIQVGVLIRKAFNDAEEYICIFKGSMVDLQLTIEAIGIKNNEILFALKQKKEQIIDRKWLKLSIDPYFEQKLQTISNDQIKKEYNRLSDIRNLKIESSIKLYKREAHKFYLRNQNDSENDKKIDLKIDYQPAEKPNIEALPILW